MRIPDYPDGNSGGIRTLNRRHPDIKPETSGHLIDQLDFTLKLIVVQCFSYHHKSVNLISLIVFSAITSRMDFFESRARIYVL